MTASLRPTIQIFQPRALGHKPWGTELLVAETPSYIGKVLLMRTGGAGGLQYHERKDETFHLFSGRVRVEWVDAEHVLRAREMFSGESYHVPPGAIHRVTALIDSVLFETSTPVFDDRVNVEAQYPAEALP